VTLRHAPLSSIAKMRIRVTISFALGLACACLGACAGPQDAAPTRWTGTGAYRELSGCVYDVLRIRWNEGTPRMTLTRSEFETRRANIVLDTFADTPPLGPRTVGYFEITFIQNGPDRVDIERRDRPHLADIEGIWTEVDRSFLACHVTKA
jgi:hypothetical protein